MRFCCLFLCFRDSKKVKFYMLETLHLDLGIFLKTLYIYIIFYNFTGIMALQFQLLFIVQIVCGFSTVKVRLTNKNNKNLSALIFLVVFLLFILPMRHKHKFNFANALKTSIPIHIIQSSINAGR